MNNAFRLVNPVLDRIMYIFKVTVFINGLNMNRIPYFILPSAYSTCRLATRTHSVRRYVYIYRERV